MSLTLHLYRFAMAAFEPFAPWVLDRRAAKGKEDRARMNERLGRASIARPPGPLVWLHGVSVGESLSLLPVVERIQVERPEMSILLTSGTVTSAALMEKRLPPPAIHQYAPIDGPAAVNRFLDHWRPDVAIFAESELWPNLITAADQRQASLALVSARLTEKSAKGWERRRAAAYDLFSRFDLILPQDPETVMRLKALGVGSGPLMNLKTAGAAPPFDKAELARLKVAAKGRKVVVAVSTHPGEEDLIAAARPPGDLLIIVPRHPARSAEITAQLRDAGRALTVRSAGDTITPATDIYLADTLGELGLFMRLADLVILGGSLVPDIGGHNPLEPARVGAPIVSGPYVHKNAALFDEMVQARAVAIVPPEDLSAATAALLHDAAARQAMADAATAYTQTLAQAFDTGWAQIRSLLPA